MDAEFLKLLHEAEQVMVPPDLKEKGWRYQDFPGKFTPQVWTYLTTLIGHEEYQLIVYSEGDGPGGAWKRGQFFISPQGYQNLKDAERQARIKQALNLN